MIQYIRQNWLSFTLITVSMIFGIFIYPHLPEMIATHFDIHGVPNDYTQKRFAVLLLPVINLVVVILIPVLIRFSPRRYKMEESQVASVGQAHASVSILLTSIHVGLLLNAYDDKKFRVDDFAAFGLIVFMIMLGNLMGKVQRNFFIGIRLPWTLASDNNWRHTHRFSGKLLVLSGLCSLICYVVFQKIEIVVFFLLMPFVASVVYSFVYFKNQKMTKPIDLSSNGKD